jgi:hypothetical protein
MTGSQEQKRQDETKHYNDSSNVTTIQFYFVAVAYGASDMTALESRGWPDDIELHDTNIGVYIAG